MRYFRITFMMMGIVVLVLVLTASPAWAGQKGQEPAKKGKVELPPAVAKAVKDNVPNAQIESVTVEKEAGIALYDIEFKAKRGEIEVAEDGTVMALQHRELPIVGLQFHPESILTEHGYPILAAFLRLAGLPVPRELPTIASELRTPDGGQEFPV